MEGPVSLGAPLEGVIRADGTVVASLNLSSVVNGLSVQATLVGRLSNRFPVAAFQIAPRLECNSPGAALVELTATVEPDLTSYQWFVNGVPSGSGATTSVRVPLGRSLVRLVVQDAQGLIDGTERQVEVVDTTPPSIDELLYRGPSCIWAPNHKYVVIDASRDLVAQISDACDSSPRVEFAGVTSSQPDNGTGDGNTADDALSNSRYACLRAERAGNAQEPREYLLSVHAVDLSGNRSDPLIPVQVSHDQRPSRRCDAFPDALRSDDPANCASPQPPQDERPSAQRRERGSCSSAGASGLVGLTLMIIIRRRVRRS